MDTLMNQVSDYMADQTEYKGIVHLILSKKRIREEAKTKEL